MRDVEEVELQALIGWHDVAVAAKLPEYDWRLVEIGDALCSVSSTEPSILVNRVLGLGSKATPTLEQLTEIRKFYGQAGVLRFFLHVVPEIVGPNGAELLTAAGYRRHRGWMKFTRGPGEVREPRTDLTIRPIDADKAADFASIVAPSFDMSPACELALATLVDDPRWHLFMSFAGNRPAGTGALFMYEGIGYLDWASTHPDFRRQGSQSAILSARLRCAFEAGCKTVVTMTGEAVPEDPQHSYSNILRAGFSEAYLRENWIPAD
jgi:GNAT superfamily N-acetyltransferase